MVTKTYALGRNESTFFSSIRWNRAIQAGLIVGCILFLVSRGIPWVGSGAVNPAIMGREIEPGKTPSGLFFMSILALHLFVSMVYALIIAPIVHGFRPFVAGCVGGVVGLVLYFINYAVSATFMGVAAAQREWPSIVLHIVFGIVVAEAYKGMARRRPIDASVLKVT
ncbi:MAG TPA: hypothetical protein VGR78_04110 [Verrucomicrobiae bacterium]|jgi:hypothetical protein|nr:hypothetical protein [Verrucomicrobiae bacterium]